MGKIPGWYVPSLSMCVQKMHPSNGAAKSQGEAS